MEHTENARSLQMQAECNAMIAQMRMVVPQLAPQNLEAIHENEARIQEALKAPYTITNVQTSRPKQSRGIAAAGFSDGSGTEEDPYIILTPEDMSNIASVLLNDVSAHYSLQADLDFSGISLSPIGSVEKPFLGHFRGNGHSFKNIKMESQGNNFGLFAKAVSAGIQDITFINAKLTANGTVGVLLGQGIECSITNINLINCRVTGYGDVAGIAGVLENSIVSNCSNDGEVAATGSSVGGLISYLMGGSMENCVFTGTVTGASYVGGIVGRTTGDLTACTNTGNIHGSLATGGIAGGLLYVDRMGWVKLCYNKGTISSFDEAGGIAGWAASYNNDMRGAHLFSVGNMGAIHSFSTCAGGLIGNAESATVIRGAYNSGAISADDCMCGGLVGRLNRDNTYLGAVQDTYNAGKVRKGDMSGLLIGYNSAIGILNSYYLIEPPTGHETEPVGYNNTAPSSFSNMIATTSVGLKANISVLNSTYFQADTNNDNYGYPILIEVDYTKGGTVKPETAFKFAGAFVDKFDTSSHYCYSDQYFETSAYQYNPHLATMSLSLAMSAFASLEQGYEEQSVNVKHLMAAIGLSGITPNASYTQKPEWDSIGVIIGKKALQLPEGTVTLLVIAIRGGGYEREWASNFTIGAAGFHEGFAQARDQVLAHLTSYIVSEGVTGRIKLWITGYSRAAATSNLVAGALDNGIALENCIYTPSDVYAYTFETPRGVLIEASQGDVYNNIFNIVNNNDPVPKVAPEVWGFKWYGIPKYVPTNESYPELYSSYKAIMLKRFKALGGDRQNKSMYLVDSFIAFRFESQLDPNTGTPITVPVPVSNMPLEKFLQNFIAAFVPRCFVDRETYTNVYQENIRLIAAIFFDPDTQYLPEVFSRKIKENLVPLFAELSLTPPVYTLLWKIVSESFSESALPPEFAEAFFDALCPIIWAVIFNFPNEAYTVIINEKVIAQAHFPEVCLAWMQSMDSYFTTNYITLPD